MSKNPQKQITVSAHHLYRVFRQKGPRYLTRAALLFLDTLSSGGGWALSLLHGWKDEFGFAAADSRGMGYVSRHEPRDLPPDFEMPRQRAKRNQANPGPIEASASSKHIPRVEQTGMPLTSLGAPASVAYETSDNETTSDSQTSENESAASKCTRALESVTVQSRLPASSVPGGASHPNSRALGAEQRTLRKRYVTTHTLPCTFD